METRLARLAGPVGGQRARPGHLRLPTAQATRLAKVSNGHVFPVGVFDAFAWQVLNAVVTARAEALSQRVFIRHLEAMLADLPDLLEVATTATH